MCGGWPGRWEEGRANVDGDTANMIEGGGGQRISMVGGGGGVNRWLLRGGG